MAHLPSGPECQNLSFSKGFMSSNHGRTTQGEKVLKCHHPPFGPKKYDLFFRGVSFLKESNDKLPEEIGGIGGGSNSPKKNTVKMYGNHQPDSSSIFLYDLIRVCRDILNLMGIELTLQSSSTPNEEKKPWDPQLVDSSASKRGARPRTRKICRWSEVDWSSTCTACRYTWGNKILFLFSPLPALCRNCHERHESWHFLSLKMQYTIHFWKVAPKTWTKLLQWATFQWISIPKLPSESCNF